MEPIQKRLGKSLESNKINQKVTYNLNHMRSAKYRLAPEKIELKSLENPQFREQYDFQMFEKVQLDAFRMKQSGKNKQETQRRKLENPLALGELVQSASIRCS